MANDNIHKNIRPLFTEIANAIRFKTGGTERIKADEFPEAINAIQVEQVGTPPGDPEWLSDDEAVLGYIQHDIAGGYKNSELTQVKSYAFHNQYGLTKVSFPECKWIGQYAFQNCSSLSWVSFLTCSVIQSYAFQSCNSLQSITAPVVEVLQPYAFEQCQALEFVQMNGVKTIQECAFRSCKNLKTITFPECETVQSQAFMYCTSLSAINLMKCTTIYHSAFQYNTGLVNVYLPMLTWVDQQAFRSCYNLETVNLPVLQTINNYAFWDCSKLQYISLYEANGTGYAAFLDCTALSTVFMPKATQISAYMFQHCTSLMSVSAPQVQTVHHHAFQNCTSLPCIDFPYCTVIYEGAFEKNYALSSCYLPSVTQIMYAAFSECSALKIVDFPSIKGDSLGSHAFRQNIELESAFFSSLQWIPEQGFIGDWKLSDVRFPLALSIGSSAFRECWSLSNATFPSATTIYERAFAECSNLRIASFSNVVSLYSAAFYGCWNLEYASFPKVSYIGNDMFMNCSKLSFINFNDAKIIGNRAFMGCSSLSVISEMAQASLIGMGAFGGTILSYVDLPSLSFMPSYLFFTTETLSQCYFSTCSDMYPFAMANTGMSIISIANFPNLKRLCYYSGVSTYWGVPSSMRAAFSYNQGTSYYYLDNAWTLGSWFSQHSEHAERLRLMMEPFAPSQERFLSELSKCPAIYAGHFAFNSKLTECTLPISTVILSSGYFGCWEACPNLEFVSLPSLATLSIGADSRINSPFNYGTFKSLYLPLLSTVRSYEFAYCWRMENIYIPKLSTLADRAFLCCSSLSTVTSEMMPSVTSIQGWAFESCINLKTVNLPAVTSISGSAFQYCSGLETVSVSSGYKTILSYTFQNCWSLSTLNMPGVNAISSYAFYWCHSLNPNQSLYFPGITNIGSIHYMAFGSDTWSTRYDPITDSTYYHQDLYFLRAIELPNASGTMNAHGPFYAQQLLSYCSIPLVKALPNNAFAFCRALSVLYAPSVTTLGSNCFSLCDSLEEVNFPILNSIGSSAFNNCIKLKSAIFPYVTSISIYAFYNCYALSSIRFTQATSIGNSAFTHCKSLTAITSETFPLVSRVGEYAFCGCPISIAYFPNCNSCPYTTFYSNADSTNDGINTWEILEEFGLGKIVSGMFLLSYYKNLWRIEFSELTVAPAYFCYSLPKLTSVMLPKVQTIQNNAFQGCTSLSTINLPECTTIYSHAFDNCSLSRIDETMFPKLTTLSSDYKIFANNSYLSYISFPKLQYLNGMFYNYSNTIFYNTPNLRKAVFNEFQDHNANLYQMFYQHSGIEEVYFPAMSVIKCNHAFFQCSNLKIISMPNLQSIMSYGNFEGCTALESVDFPALTYIGTRHTFLDCTSLKTVNLPLLSLISGESYGTFQNCHALETVSLPELTNIPRTTFAYCSNLKSVHLPKVTSISSGTEYAYHTSNPFCGCLALEHLELNALPVLNFNMIGHWNGGDYQHIPLKTLIIPAVHTLGQSACYNFIKMESIYAPNLKTIGSTAFCGCSSLKEVDFPLLSSVIGNNQFQSCYSLTKASLPEVTTVNDGFFHHCSSLSEVHMDKLTYIGPWMFTKCSNLKSLYLPEVTSIFRMSSARHGSSPFEGVDMDYLELPKLSSFPDYNGFNAQLNNSKGIIRSLSLATCTVVSSHAFGYQSQLSKIYIPECLDIGSHAFCSTAISEVSIPKCSRVDVEAFAYCSNLTSLDMPVVLHVNSPAKGCVNLHTISFGTSLVSIWGYNTFNNCSKLKSIYILTNSVPLLQYSIESVFYNSPILKSTFSDPPEFASIYVKESMVDAFKTAWSQISDRITAYIP